jgi:hypothetical protein
MASRAFPFICVLLPSLAAVEMEEDGPITITLFDKKRLDKEICWDRHYGKQGDKANKTADLMA